MTKTIAYDAAEALRAANLTCWCVDVRPLGAERLSIETTHYTVAERVLADAGLVLVDIHATPSMTLARIVRAKVSKR